MLELMLLFNALGTEKQANKQTNWHCWEYERGRALLTASSTFRGVRVLACNIQLEARRKKKRLRSQTVGREGETFRRVWATQRKLAKNPKQIGF